MKMQDFPLISALMAVAALLLSNPAALADENDTVAILYKQGSFAKALEQADAYLALKPKDAQMRFQKGLILTEQNKTADAIGIFSSLAEEYPDLPEPYNNLAVLYASQGQYDKAKGALEAAIRTHPSYATAHENLGDVYAKMASQAYGKALQLDKGNAAAQTKLAMIKDLFTGSRSAWEKSRRERIGKPKSIQIAITNPKVNLTDTTHARVSFKQSYHSDAIRSHTTKTLEMVKTGEKWLIQQEQAGR